MARKPTNGIEGSVIEPGNEAPTDSNIIDGDVIRSNESDPDIDSADSRVINPGDIIAGEPDASESAPGKRGRGRPRGSKSTSTKSRKETSQDLGGAIYSIHFMLSKWIGIQELEIEDSEAEKLAAAILRVNKLYGDKVIPESVLAWGGLLMTCGAVYGPRFAAHGLRVKAEAEKKKNENPQTIPGVILN
jgi:hypothetical protein